MQNFLTPLASCLTPPASCLLPLAFCLSPLAFCLMPLATALIPDVLAQNPAFWTFGLCCFFAGGFFTLATAILLADEVRPPATDPVASLICQDCRSTITAGRSHLIALSLCPICMEKRHETLLGNLEEGAPTFLSASTPPSPSDLSSVAPPGAKEEASREGGSFPSLF